MLPLCFSHTHILSNYNSKATAKVVTCVPWWASMSPPMTCGPKDALPLRRLFGVGLPPLSLDRRLGTIVSVATAEPLLLIPGVGASGLLLLRSCREEDVGELIAMGGEKTRYEHFPRFL